MLSKCQFHVDFKAALINIFMLTKDQMTVCTVKGVTDSGETKELSLKPAVLLSSMEHFNVCNVNSLFWFYRQNLNCIGWLSPLSLTLLASGRQSAVHNSAEYLAVQEPDIFFSGVGGDQNKATKKVYFGLTFAEWNMTPVDADVALCLPGV